MGSMLDDLLFPIYIDLQIMFTIFIFDHVRKRTVFIDSKIDDMVMINCVFDNSLSLYSSFTFNKSLA